MSFASPTISEAISATISEVKITVTLEVKCKLNDYHYYYGKSTRPVTRRQKSEDELIHQRMEMEAEAKKAALMECFKKHLGFTEFNDLVYDELHRPLTPTPHQSLPNPNTNMETDLPILEEINKSPTELPTHEAPPSKPPTEPPAQLPSQKASQPPKLPSSQQPTKIINDTAKTLNVFPPISPVPERKNPSGPITRTCSVITPHKTTPS